jgi:acyl dehydratase
MDAERSFETVAVGDELTPLTLGPFTPIHLMRFSAAIENWHRIHYDERFARDHDGLPGLLVSGSFKQHFAAQMVRAWAGPGARLLRIGMQFRAMNVAGEILTAWGRVTALDAREEFGLVSCELGIRTDNGLQSSPGTAEVALPLTAGGALSYPITDRVTS